MQGFIKKTIHLMGNVFLNRFQTTLDITWRIQSVAQVWFIEPSNKSDPYDSISSK